METFNDDSNHIYTISKKIASGSENPKQIYLLKNISFLFINPRQILLLNMIIFGNTSEFDGVNGSIIEYIWMQCQNRFLLFTPHRQIHTVTFSFILSFSFIWLDSLNADFCHKHSLYTHSILKVIVIKLNNIIAKVGYFEISIVL